ncbi:MAG: glycoside hydrolase [Patescibacteria group bacterium]|nr:MAG: glycoside hydrolase [Patescibacteria group bacterium]
MIKHLRTSERFSVVGEHFYQPSRSASHIRLKHLRTSDTDWNAVIARECYIPQLQSGTLEKASFDFYATIRRDMLRIAPKESVALRESMRARGVGDPYLHALLPDLPERDKVILVQAGWEAFKKDAGGVPPQWFWAPETALDTQTLEVLARVGYKGVICAPEQIGGVKGEIDNFPVRIKLKSRAEILLLPFDRPLSSQFAFEDKSNADRFADQVVKPRILRLPKSVPIIGWTDGETFGHHAKFADKFLQHLVSSSLPSIGVAVLGLNQIQEVWDKNDYRDGRLRERTAWSCPHGDLARWHKECPCDAGWHGGWKRSFSNALAELNRQVDSVLDKQLGRFWSEELAKNFDTYFYFHGEVKNNKKSLYAAKASALGAQISCGTFFDNPGTSGTINMLFARQTLEHLIDAGYSRLAQQLKQQFLQTLSNGMDPHTKKQLDKYFAYYFN